MAQLETTRTIPPRLGNLGPAGVSRSETGSNTRARTAKLLMAAALATGFVLANALPAVRLDGGTSLTLTEVAEKLTRLGSGWVMTLAWLAGLIALVSVFVFPRSERFIQTLAVSSTSLVVLVIPFFVAKHLQLIDPKAIGLGSGLWGLTAAFALVAVIPWLSLLWWNRTKPVLGYDWSKWVFLLPAVVWVLLLTVFPLAFAITTSRYAFRTGRITHYVGWDNYKKLFHIQSPATIILTALLLIAAVSVVVLVIGAVLTWLDDHQLTRADLRHIAGFIPIVAVPALIAYLTRSILQKDVSAQLWVTYIFVVGSVVSEMILGFLLALLFNRELRGRSALRTIMTLPIFATPVAIGYLGRTIFYEGGGPVNGLLTAIGITPPPWLSDPVWAKVTTIIADAWEWTPFVFIIALAGLQGLPQDVIEASEVDGATPFQVLRYVTLPLMAPILWLILLLRSIDAFKVFDLVVAMTLGGPGQATRYYSYFTYLTGRKFFNYGQAAAQAFLLLFIVMVLVSLLWGRIRHIYEEDRGVPA